MDTDANLHKKDSEKKVEYLRVVKNSLKERRKEGREKEGRKEVI